MASEDIKPECLIDEQRVEFSYPAHDERLEEGERKKTVSVGIGECFPGLFLFPNFLLDTLIVGPDPFDKFGFLFFGSPLDSGGTVG